MPNGRSGGFCFKRGELEQLLGECENSAPVGKTVKNAVTAHELRQFLNQWNGSEVWVEEQDHAWYIVHFSEREFDRWVTVGPDSPLFEAFRRQHREWLKEWARKHQSS